MMMKNRTSTARGGGYDGFVRELTFTAQTETQAGRALFAFGMKGCAGGLWWWGGGCQNLSELVD